MSFLRTRSKREGLLETATDSLTAIRDGVDRSRLWKGALIAGGVAALTAGSAAISSLRRRIETNS
jgi:hypothetical protein